MQPTAPDVKPAESSPAPTFTPPTEAKAYQDWRMTGAIPEAAPEKPAEQPKPEESAPSKESAPAAQPEAKQQEPQPRKGKDAEARLQSILSDLREAGLSPAQLKTFKQDWQRAQAHEPPAPAKAPEPTAKPQGDGAPQKPKLDDYQTFEEYEAAKDEYFEKVAEYKAQRRLESWVQDLHAEAQQRELAARVKAATERYGAEAEQTIRETAGALWNDQAIPDMVKTVLADSPALMDVLYTLGSDHVELSAFIDLARTNPGAAIRAAVSLEGRVGQAAPAESKPEPQRDASGRFVPAAAKPPAEKKPTDAPPPPARELSTRGSTPADEIGSAVASGDFRTYMAAANRRDLARMRGQ